MADKQKMLEMVNVTINKMKTVAFEQLVLTLTKLKSCTAIITSGINVEQQYNYYIRLRFELIFNVGFVALLFMPERQEDIDWDQESALNLKLGKVEVLGGHQKGGGGKGAFGLAALFAILVALYDDIGHVSTKLGIYEKLEVRTLGEKGMPGTLYVACNALRATSGALAMNFKEETGPQVVELFKHFSHISASLYDDLYAANTFGHHNARSVPNKYMLEYDKDNIYLKFPSSTEVAAETRAMEAYLEKTKSLLKSDTPSVGVVATLGAEATLISLAAYFMTNKPQAAAVIPAVIAPENRMRNVYNSIYTFIEFSIKNPLSSAAVVSAADTVVNNALTQTIRAGTSFSETEADYIQATKDALRGGKENPDYDFVARQADIEENLRILEMISELQNSLISSPSGRNFIDTLTSAMINHKKKESKIDTSDPKYSLTSRSILHEKNKSMLIAVHTWLPKKLQSTIDSCKTYFGYVVKEAVVNSMSGVATGGTDLFIALFKKSLSLVGTNPIAGGVMLFMNILFLGAALMWLLKTSGLHNLKFTRSIGTQQLAPASTPAVTAQVVNGEPPLATVVAPAVATEVQVPGAGAVVLARQATAAPEAAPAVAAAAPEELLVDRAGRALIAADAAGDANSANEITAYLENPDTVVVPMGTINQYAPAPLVAMGGRRYMKSTRKMNKRYRKTKRVNRARMGGRRKTNRRKYKKTLYRR